MQDDASTLSQVETHGEIETTSTVVRLWRRLPLLVRAILSGLFVFFVIQNGWLAMFLVNTQILPTVPWSVALGLIWIWLLFRYFNGRGWPASTSAARREAMRAPRPTGPQWAWSMVFFVAFLVFFVSFIQVFYRFVVIPEDNFDLSMFPWWSLYPCLVMVSITAGVSEEAGFRGYMQGGLEKRYGPVLAIGITSFVFWLSHLNHASGPARFALLMVMSAALGALAYCVGSIWPSVVTHASVNTIAFVSGAADAAPWFIQQPPQFSETGVDASFVVFLLLFAASTAALAFVLRMLRALRPAT